MLVRPMASKQLGEGSPQRLLSGCPHLVLAYTRGNGKDLSHSRVDDNDAHSGSSFLLYIIQRPQIWAPHGLLMLG